MTNKDYKRLTRKWETSLPTELTPCVHIHDRLWKIENAIEDGTLVFLPCKVGVTVHEVFKNHRPPIIQQTKIEKIIITEKGLRLKLERNSVYETSITACGKTLFFTKEAAENAVEEAKKC